jgi:DNA-binding transcriptional regulator GbsR (MarR family)
MPVTLDDCKALLVRRWGELGGYWGINRTMAEIHALLFVSGQPLCTDDVMGQLHVSRGNASMNLRALVDWGLIRRVHKLGDRKEYFQADTDVWHMFETITRERRRREVEPIIETIARCRAMLPAPARGTGGPDAGEIAAFARRLDELQGFLTAMGTLFELLLRFRGPGVELLVELASRADEPPRKGTEAQRGLQPQGTRARGHEGTKGRPRN